jgi:hypothetical protein
LQEHAQLRVECSLVPAKKELVAKKEIEAGVIGTN